jgi:hypothetical protein
MKPPSHTSVGLSDAFAADAAKQTQWQAFLKKNRLNGVALSEVVAFLRANFEVLVDDSAA